MSSYSLRNTALFVDTSGVSLLRRTYGVPAEWDGSKVLIRDYSVPVDVGGAVGRLFSTPVDATAALGHRGARIMTAEYVGNGSSPRAFTVAEYTPALVLVVGRDGANNLVGAIKTSAMPLGKSQPLENDPAAGAASRSDRIEDIYTNGFTVGATLNVAGRVYTYVAFPPDVPASVKVGSYTGVGGTALGFNSATLNIVGDLVSNATVNVHDCDTTKWNRPFADTPYSVGVDLTVGGRRMIRLSDGAVICEATTFVSGTSFRGTIYIPGSFGPGTWDWEEQYVEVGQFADAAWWMADAAIGTSPIPSQFAPGVMQDGSQQNFNATGFAPAPTWFPAGDSRIHTAGPGDTLDVQYHYVAFRQAPLLSGVELATVSYTGTGPGGPAPNLLGQSFSPGWAMAFYTGNTLRFAKKDSAVVGPLETNILWDGQGVNTSDDPTFEADGISIPTTSTWNSPGPDYRVVMWKLYTSTLARDLTVPAEWTRDLHRDLGIPIEWARELLRRDFGVPVEWFGAVARQFGVPTEWFATLLRETTSPVEWVAQVARDTGIPVEWLHGLSRDAGIPVEWFAALARHYALPVEWVADLHRNTGAPVEWLQQLTRPASVPVEWTAQLARNASVPVEWFSGLVRDLGVPAEWTSTLRRNATIPVEWVALLFRAVGIPVEWVGPTVLMRDFGVPAEWIALLRRDYGTPIEWLQALTRNYGIPTEWAAVLLRAAGIPVEWTALLQAGMPTPVEWIRNLARDYGTPVEWFRALQRNFGVPVEFLQLAARVFGVPADWLSTVNRKYGVPVEWDQPFPIHKRDFGIPAEWTGRLASSLLVIWDVRVRLAAPLLVSWTVVSGALVAMLQVVWTVRSASTPLTVVWTVLPNIVEPFMNDIQKPVGDVDENPLGGG